MESKIIKCDKPFDINQEIRSEISAKCQKKLEELDNKCDYYAVRFKEDANPKIKKTYPTVKPMKPFKDYCDDEYLINCEQVDDTELDMFPDDDEIYEWREASLEAVRAFKEWFENTDTVLEQAYQLHVNAVRNYCDNKGPKPMKQRPFMENYVRKVLRA